MNKLFSMSEVCRITGLAPHTIRFYETQFPKHLAVERTSGGHRKYRQQHIDVLNHIVELAKNERKSLREIREIIGEDPLPTTLYAPAALNDCEESVNAHPVVGANQSDKKLDETLNLILKNLEELNVKNDRLDKLLEMLLAATNHFDVQPLVTHIDSLKSDTGRTINDSRKSLIDLGFGTLFDGNHEYGDNEH